MGGNAITVLRLRRLLPAAVSLAVSGAALGWVLRAFDLRTFLNQTGSLQWGWMAAAALFDVASYVTQGVRWRRLLKPVARVSLLHSVRAIYAGLFVNEVAPMRPGEALRAVLIARQTRQPVMRIVPTMVAERLMDGAWLCAALAVAAYVLRLPDAMRQAVSYFAAVLAVAAVALFLVRRRKAFEWTTAFRDRMAFAVSLGVLAGQGLAFWAALRACSLRLSIAAAMAVMLIVRLGTMLPAAPANIGTHQASLILALSLFGVGRAPATSVSFIVFAVLTVPLWVLGFLALMSSGVSLRAVFGRRRQSNGSTMGRTPAPGGEPEPRRQAAAMHG